MVLEVRNLTLLHHKLCRRRAEAVLRADLPVRSAYPLFDEVVTGGATTTIRYALRAIE
jgi:hypothetical protein